MSTKENKKILKKLVLIVTIFDKCHPPAKVGNNVIPIPIPISDVDRSKGDLRNLFGVSLQTNYEGLYKIVTKHCVL